MNEVKALRALAALARAAGLAIFRVLVVAGLGGLRPGGLALACATMGVSRVGLRLCNTHLLNSH